MSTVGASAAVPAGVVQQLKTMSGHGPHLARGIEQGGVKSYFGETIRFASWDDDVANFDGKVEQITSDIGQIEGEIESINQKNAEWKKAHPVKSFFLTAGKVAAYALYWAAMITCITFVIGIPIFIRCESQFKDVKVSSRIWHGNKLANKRGELKGKLRERFSLKRFKINAQAERDYLNRARTEVLPQLRGRLSTAPTDKRAKIQATIDYLQSMNF